MDSSYKLLYVLLLLIAASAENPTAPSLEDVQCLSRSKAIKKSSETLALLDSLCNSENLKKWESFVNSTLTTSINQLAKVQLTRTASGLNDVVARLRSAAYQYFTVATEAKGWIAYSGEQFEHYNRQESTKIPILKNVLSQAHETIGKIKVSLRSIRSELKATRESIAKVKTDVPKDREEILGKIRNDKRLKVVLNKVETVALLGEVCVPAAAVVSVIVNLGMSIPAFAACANAIFYLLDTKDLTAEKKIDLFVDKMEAIEEAYTAMDHFVAVEMERVDGTIKSLGYNTSVANFCDGDELGDQACESSVVDRFKELSKFYSDLDYEE